MADKYLPIDKILAILNETPSRLTELTSRLEPSQLNNAPGAGEWSAREVLAHLRACEDVWGRYYIMTIMAEDKPTIRARNPRTWIKETDYLEQDFQASLRAFTSQRRKFLKVLESLSPEDWGRTNTLIGAGKPRQQTLLSHADGLARHERAHLKQIEQNLNRMKNAT